MGGHQVPGMGTGDDGYDEDGYDESQRAEILEATRSGPVDGAIVTDLSPDLGTDDDEDEPIDDIDMDSEAVGETDLDRVDGRGRYRRGRRPGRARRWQHRR
ncbi:hypothetical protein [Sphingomonas aerolata]|uniref:hypothetical protein n=1 Tax=Sphingomonas aerolata TaxID=185951 RepID=UPI002FE19DEF